VKKRALGVVSVVFLLVALNQFVLLVGATSVPYPTDPNTEPPTLVVETPVNGSDSYAENSLTLVFSVTKPESWNQYHMGIPVVGDYYVNVYLDENLDSTYYDPLVADQLTANYDVALNHLSNEQHTLKIDVNARTFYENPDSGGAAFKEHFITTSATINFTINPDQKTIQFSIDQTDPIPEFPSWLILPLFISITLAVIAIRKKLTSSGYRKQK
jgi:hypothetical protein